MESGSRKVGKSESQEDGKSGSRKVRESGRPKDSKLGRESRPEFVLVYLILAFSI